MGINTNNSIQNLCNSETHPDADPENFQGGGWQVKITI